MAEYLSDLKTPSVVIDREKLRQNIGRVRDIGAAHGLEVRPHAKTHKCLEIARMQMDEGAVGLTCSQTDEGIELLKGGVPSITVGEVTDSAVWKASRASPWRRDRPGGDAGGGKTLGGARLGRTKGKRYPAGHPRQDPAEPLLRRRQSSGSVHALRRQGRGHRRLARCRPR